MDTQKVMILRCSDSFGLLILSLENLLIDLSLENPSYQGTKSTVQDILQQ